MFFIMLAVILVSDLFTYKSLYHTDGPQLKQMYSTYGRYLIIKLGATEIVISKADKNAFRNSFCLNSIIQRTKETRIILSLQNP